MLSADADDVDDVEKSPCVTGTSRVPFQYFVKGTLGKKHKALVVDLEKQTLILSNSSEIPTSSVVSTSKISTTPGGLVLSLRQDAKLQEIKWFFKSMDECSLFQLYVATLNNYGSQMLTVFRTMDLKNRGEITWRDLRKCAHKHGVHLSQAEAEAMIVIADENGNRYLDYAEFFRFFLHSSVCSVNACIIEWTNRLADDLKRTQPRASRATIDILELQHANEGDPRFLSKDSAPRLIGGEVVLNIVQHVRYTLYPSHLRNPPPPFVGNIYFTSYRLVFCSYVRGQASFNTRMEISPYFDEMSIPLSTILRLEPLKADPNYSLVIICKDTRAVRVEFDAAGSFTSTFLDVLSSHAFPGAVAQTFAFFNKQHFPQPRFPLSGGMDWWTLYSAQEEFSRQGVIPSDLWYLYNDNYSTVDTYPRDFILPSQFSMSDVGEVAKFRSKGRIPALTYRNYRNGAVLCRSAQPLVGVLRHRSQADKFLLNLFRLRGDVNDRSEIDSPSDFYVFDCRKPIAATANSALGKGVEDEKAYEHAKVIFLDIENIHTMRSCCRALEEALSTVGYGGTQLDSASASNTADSDSRFMSRIEETEWLVHIRKILQASLQVAEKLELERASVLVHCSDGWDRTAQVCATTQVLLDPFFRTLKGLAVLVEKDWCSFGYKFQDRMGHAESTADSQERSPVFLQWLDTLHQLLLQFPNQFEYNQRLLVFLADSSFSCQFGNFLGNSDRERKVELQVESRTRSVWGYIFSCPRHSFTNPQYAHCEAPLWPSVSPRSLKLWERYFLRWEPDAHPRCLSGLVWEDDWGDRAGLAAENAARTTSVGTSRKPPPQQVLPSLSEEDSSDPAKATATTTTTSVSDGEGNHRSGRSGSGEGDRSHRIRCDSGSNTAATAGGGRGTARPPTVDKSDQLCSRVDEMRDGACSGSSGGGDTDSKSSGCKSGKAGKEPVIVRNSRFHAL